jgi:AhpD family alkylhydroperoxidase
VECTRIRTTRMQTADTFLCRGRMTNVTAETGSKTSSSARVDYRRVSPEAMRAMAALERFVQGSGLESRLVELVKLRASYINGCAYCVDVHTKDARVAGESEQRLFAIPVWHETPYFTPRERAALAWTESVTDIGHSGVPDDVYEQARAEFSETELLALTMAIIAINGWTRLAVSFRTEPGTYQPRGARHAMAAAG